MLLNIKEQLCKRGQVTMRFRDAEKMLDSGGFYLKRRGGNHYIFTNGVYNIAVSGGTHKNYRLKPFLKSEIRKGNRIKENGGKAGNPIQETG